MDFTWRASSSIVTQAAETWCQLKITTCAFIMNIFLLFLDTHHLTLFTLIPITKFWKMSIGPCFSENRKGWPTSTNYLPNFTINSSTIWWYYEITHPLVSNNCEGNFICVCCQEINQSNTILIVCVVSSRLHFFVQKPVDKLDRWNSEGW